MSIEEIRHLSGDMTAHWVDPLPPVKVELSQGATDTEGAVIEAPMYRGKEFEPRLYEPLSPVRALRFGDLYLVEPWDDRGDWYMGSMDDSGTIRCWGTYGDLHTAVQSL